MSGAMVMADAVVMPAEMTDAMEQVWRNAFHTHCRRRRNCGPKKADRILAESAEQVAYKAVLAFVRKHNGFPP